MPSSYTSSARYNLQATGENNNTWGVKLNTNALQLVDDNVNGRQALTVTGARALVAANGVTDEQRMAFLDVTSGSGGTIGIGNAPKGYFIRNAATGAVTPVASGGTGPAFQSGDAGPVFSDGAQVYGLQIAGLSIRDYVAGQITGSGNLPSPVGNLNKVAVVRDHGTGPLWIPDVLDSLSLAAGTAAANLGYTPANRAGDNFTGAISATTIAAGSTNPYNLLRLDGDGAYSTLSFNYASGSYLRYQISNGLLTYAVNNTQLLSIDLGGNAHFAGQLSAASIAYTAGSIPGSAIAGNSIGSAQITDGSIQGGDIANGAVGNSQIANGSINNWHIVDGQVTASKLAAGVAQANLGFLPVNRAGDTVTGPLTVNGNFVAQANATVAGQLKGIAGVFAGNSGRIAIGGDDSTFSRLYLDSANGCFIHCNWSTGKISFYIGNLIVMSIDAAGNLVARGTFAFTTVPTP